MSRTVVKLTDDEKRMLQGEKGSVRKTCMAYLVEMAEIISMARAICTPQASRCHHTIAYP